MEVWLYLADWNVGSRLAAEAKELPVRKKAGPASHS
jgi:hypothetical protein